MHIAENSSARGGKWRVLNIRGSRDYHSKHSVRASITRADPCQRSMCLRYGAAQPLRSNLFRSFPASRYRTVAERVMDAGASLLRGTYETRGAPLRSSASDVGHFIPCSPPSSAFFFSAPSPPRFGSGILNNARQFTIDTACPFELVTRARGNAPELTKALWRTDEKKRRSPGDVERAFSKLRY